MLKRIVVMFASLLVEVSAYFSRKSCHLMKTKGVDMEPLPDLIDVRDVE